jgi:hypothetical protein
LNKFLGTASCGALEAGRKDDTVRRAVALYLAEKAKNGTLRQREITEKSYKDTPFLNPGLLLLQNQ